MKPEHERVARIGAIMAVSNLGHFHNLNLESAIDPRGGWGDNARYDVCNIAGHLMECDDHEELFGDEAQRFEDELLGIGIEDFIKLYPHHEEWLRKVWAA